MPESANVIDGESEPSADGLIAAIEGKRALWDKTVVRGVGHEGEPGVAGEWSLRDVTAHINYYLRFHIQNLGGPARSFDDMPQDVASDMEKRNQWMHEADRGLSWEFVQEEGFELHRELIAQLRKRAPEEFRTQLTSWHPWPMWRWMCDARNHYDEHQPLLEAWLESKSL